MLVRHMLLCWMALIQKVLRNRIWTLKYGVPELLFIKPRLVFMQRNKK